MGRCLHRESASGKLCIEYIDDFVWLTMIIVSFPHAIWDCLQLYIFGCCCSHRESASSRLYISFDDVFEFNDVSFASADQWGIR